MLKRQITLMILLIAFISLIAMDPVSAKPEAIIPDPVLSMATGGSNDELFNCIINLTDSGYIAAGYTESFGNNDSDFYVVKFDRYNKVVWSRAYMRPGGQSAFSICETPEGRYVVAGYTYVNESSKIDYSAIELDRNGNIIWERTYGGVENDYCFSVIPAVDGGYIMAGQSYSFSNTNSDIYVVKIDDNGNMVWDNIYGGLNKEVGHCIIPSYDGGYVIAGLTKSYGNQGGDALGNGAEDVYLISINRSGKLIWERTFGGPDYDEGYSVIYSNDGGYVIAGTTKSSGTGQADILLIKTDASGLSIWNNTYGGTADDGGFSVINIPEGGYMIAGMTKSYGLGSLDGIIYKIGENGTMIEGKTFGKQEDDGILSIAHNTDGGLAIAGYTGSGGHGGMDGYIIMFDNASVVPSVTVSATKNAPAGTEYAPLFILTALLALSQVVYLFRARK